MILTVLENKNVKLELKENLLNDLEPYITKNKEERMKNYKETMKNISKDQ